MIPPSPSDSPASSNIVRLSSLMRREERAGLLRQHGSVIWLTGLSGAGKSTIACVLEASLVRDGHFAYVLDGDNIRHGLNRDLGFSPTERHENIRRVGEVAHLFADAGAIAIVSLISPYLSDRAAARAAAGERPFLEVYVDAPLNVCEARDPKGLYRKARAGVIREFTGIDAPYEAPTSPDLHLHTEEQSATESALAVRELLRTRGILNPHEKHDGGI